MPLRSPCGVALGVIERQSGHSTPHALFVPMHYEPNYAYPLLVWLHGPGDDERQLQRVMPLISLRNYMAVGPRGVSPRCGKVAACTIGGKTKARSIARRTAVFDCIDLVERSL